MKVKVKTGYVGRVLLLQFFVTLVVIRSVGEGPAVAFLTPVVLLAIDRLDLALTWLGRRWLQFG